MTLKQEAARLADKLVSNARKQYEQETRILKKCLLEVTPGLEALTAPMDDPHYIKDKELALSVCSMLIHTGLESGKMKQGSIAHKLGLLLYNYIEREIKKD